MHHSKTGCCSGVFLLSPADSCVAIGKSHTGMNSGSMAGVKTHADNADVGHFEKPWYSRSVRKKYDTIEGPSPQKCDLARTGGKAAIGRLRAKKNHVHLDRNDGRLSPP